MYFTKLNCGCLILYIDDPRLPSVPPLQLSVPKSYPNDCPQWIRTPVFVPDGISSIDMQSSNEGILRVAQ